MKIISVYGSKGEYQGNAYDNIVIQVYKDEPYQLGKTKKHYAGELIDNIKIKRTDVINTIGMAVESFDWSKVIGCDIVPSYNQFGNPVSFIIKDPVKDTSSDDSY